MTTQDTSSFFTTHQSRDVPRDQWGRYKLPGPDGTEESWTRATTLAATMAEQYGLSIWKQRQVVWGLSRRPDLMTMAQTIAGPEDKKALGAIVDEAHIAAGTQSKANRGTAIHSATAAAERGAFDQVPEELRPHVAGYFAELKRQQLQVIPEYVERTVIVPEYQTAGTSDNLLRCPDGKIRVGDKKTGRMDYSDIEFAIQMSLYANASAMFNYDTGQYEPMPEIAKDYAILMVIDPETGHCEAQRINIAWGWMWARTAFEVMAIRKTKAVITPLIPPEVNDTLEPLMRDLPGPGAPIADTLREHAGLQASMRDGTFTVTGQPEGNTKFGPAVPIGEVRKLTGPTPVPASMVPEMSAADRGFWDVRPDGTPLQSNDARDLTHMLKGTVPNAGVSVDGRPAPECQAFWAQPFDGDDEPDDTTVNGVPLEQFGQPSPWGCSRGEPCEFTGDDGLHSDGTVCLYGNARPGPIPPMPVGEQEPVPGEAPELDGDQPSNLDDIATEMNKLSKAQAQTAARAVMTAVGLTEGQPGGIKLSQYKAKIVNETIALAQRHSISIPNPKDPAAPFGVPFGSIPTDSASGAGAPAQKAKGDAGATGVPAQQPDDQREEKVRAAVESIRQQNSIEGLQDRHAYYSRTSIGWTEEMQNAARVRAAELDTVSGESALTPLEMIQGATSRETLTKAWQIATAEGGGGWTEELNAAAMAKEAELAQRAGGAQ